MEPDEIVQALAALAQGTRLAAFRALVTAGPSGLQPTALATTLGIPPNTLSFHLKALLSAGLVSQERQGRALIYRADFEHLLDIFTHLTQDCCGGTPCAVSPLVETKP